MGCKLRRIKTCPFTKPDRCNQKDLTQDRHSGQITKNSNHEGAKALNHSKTGSVILP